MQLRLEDIQFSQRLDLRRGIKTKSIGQHAQKPQHVRGQQVQIRRPGLDRRALVQLEIVSILARRTLDSCLTDISIET